MLEGAQVIVKRDEKRGQRACAFEGFETGSGPSVKLIGAICAFNQLFERTEIMADLVEILESDDCLSGDDGLFDDLIVSYDSVVV